MALAMGFDAGTTKVPRGGGRKPEDKQRRLADLAAIAAAYDVAKHDRTHPGPHARVQGMLESVEFTRGEVRGGIFLARVTLRSKVREARIAGLLTDTTKRKAGGDLTPLARRILREAGFKAPWYRPRKGTK
jgi:hypothetical protein